MTTIYRATNIIMSKGKGKSSSKCNLLMQHGKALNMHTFTLHLAIWVSRLVVKLGCSLSQPHSDLPLCLCAVPYLHCTKD